MSHHDLLTPVATRRTKMPVVQARPDEASDMRAVRLALSRFSHVTTVGDLCAVTADIARSVSGAFRVEIFGLDPDGTIRVLAESMRGTTGPVTGDLGGIEDWPPGLCETLTCQRVMSISLSRIRDVIDPEHFGTGAAMDRFRALGASGVLLAALVHQDNLIGIVACLGRDEAPIAGPLIGMVETLAGMASLQLAALRHQDVLKQDRASRANLVNVMESLYRTPSLTGRLHQLGPDLLHMVHADGFAIVEQGDVSTHGRTPVPDELVILADAARGRLASGPVIEGGIDRGPAAQAPHGTGDPGASALIVAVPAYGIALFWLRYPVPTGSGLRAAPPWRDIDMDCGQRVVQLVDAIMTHHHLAETEEQLRTKSERLDQSNEELERFAHIASHDLREPLRMVTSYCRLIDRRYADRLDDTAREFIGFAVEGAQRMDHLVTGLMTYSRIATHGAPFKPVDLGRLMDRLLSNSAATIQETDADIAVGGLPVIDGDARQLSLMIGHLLDNALKFVANGDRPQVRIDAVDRDDEVDLVVEDEGIGVNPEFAASIFDLFRRLHTREVYPGAGLGLAICRRVASRHGGTIRHERKDTGSRVVVTLPKTRPVPKPSP